MTTTNKKELTPEQGAELIKILKTRFDKNSSRHLAIDWARVQSKLEVNPGKLWSLNEMESTGGEPDVIEYDENSDQFVFIDCSPETPKGRRSICYDHEALESRKEYKPANSVMEMASEMGIELLNEEQYRKLQQLGIFDSKTSSWILTPDKIRKLGGALFCDRRYNHVFTYHNGAESYYGVRGFRGRLMV